MREVLIVRNQKHEKMREMSDAGCRENSRFIVGFSVETDFHLMAMNVLLSAVTRIPVSLEERLGVGFMETGKFRIVRW